MKLRALFVGCALILGGCASAPNQETVDDYEDARDPLESVNRKVWDFNRDVLDAYILKPTANVYQDVMPQPVRKGLHNMAQNLEEPSTVVNDLLQAKFLKALEDTSRFVLNSTVGVLGLFDVAKEVGLERRHEDFGETMGVWGVGEGPYLMLPAMGPTVPRQAVGDFVDTLYFPLADLTFWPSLFRMGVNTLETRISLMDQEGLLENSLDPYNFVKDAYYQNLLNQVYDGNPPINEEEYEDFDEELEDLEEEF